jgi:hypothetical protein
MKISNDSKYFIKIAFLFFIIMSSFYIYYLLSNEFKISEGFAGASDCSDCKVKPSSGNCIPIYDISYKVVTNTNSGSGLLLDNLTISYESTPLLFCEWQPSPSCISNNLPSLEQRLGYTNSQIQNTQMELDTITCCSGSTSSFYRDSTTTFNAITKNTVNATICSALDNDLKSRFNNNSVVNFDEVNFTNLQQLETNFDYRLVKSLCNDLSNNAYKPGLLFKKIDNSTNIFDVPNILPKDLIDFIMNSNFATKLPLVDAITGTRINDISYARNLEARNKINGHLQLFEYLNDQLISRQTNLFRRAVYDDLTTLEKNNFRQAKADLKTLFIGNGIPVTNYLDISYNLLLKTTNNAPTSYLLNKDEFFNCFGQINQDNSGVFSASDLLDLSNNDYFGTGTDASYGAFGSNIITGYPSANDLQMELARLERIPSSGNAPVSIINTYLNAINSFYEKQISNLTGPRDHVFNQELVFDNNTLETVTPTFFTYDDTANNTYQCQESVTGNSLFKDCGPAAYVGFQSF